MNYANMIEEKNLKKTFIIATLCSTLIGTFTSSIGLWDRVQDKRRQKRRDTKQDDEIAKLRTQVEEAERRSQEKESRPRGRRGDDDDDLGYALERSGAAIGREFDEGYARLGRRFAVGDTVTENRLQAQVIALQQTVISVLQDALYGGRPLDRVDMAKLMAASNAARDGSLDALRQQRQRQLLALEDGGGPANPPPPQRALLPPPGKRYSLVLDDAEPLYCRYALDLQYVRNKPLAASFAPGGSCRCPECGVRLDAAADDVWEIDKRGPPRRDSAVAGVVVVDERAFHLGQRFVVKCHTPDGGYACVLCSRHRDSDAICPSVRALVNHVGRAHDVRELERELDFDVRAVRTRAVPLPALPPSAPSPPPPKKASRPTFEVRRPGSDFDLDIDSGRSSGPSSGGYS